MATKLFHFCGEKKKEREIYGLLGKLFFFFYHFQMKLLFISIESEEHIAVKFCFSGKFEKKIQLIRIITLLNKQFFIFVNEIFLKSRDIFFIF